MKRDFAEGIAGEATARARPGALGPAGGGEPLPEPLYGCFVGFVSSRGCRRGAGGEPGTRVQAPPPRPGCRDRHVTDRSASGSGRVDALVILLAGANEKPQDRADRAEPAGG